MSGLGRAVSALVIVVLAIVAFQFLPGHNFDYSSDASKAVAVAASSTPPLPPPATHVPTPAAVKAIYMTACIAGTPTLRQKLLNVVKDTDINSIVIDIKDYTGTISYASSTVPGPTGKGCRVYDLPAFIEQLHKDGLYVIGRITVFQDPLYAAAHPEVAVASRSHPDHPWTDKKGLAYIDPDFRNYWGRVVAIAEEGHSIGYDEINFDYIRFPSDGDMSDAHFALTGSTTRAEVITDFFSYLHSQLAPQGITISADIFGQTTINTDDMGIGQILENALPYFDYVAPMVYPSHFINGFEGFSDPAEHPYEVINSTMISAVERAVAASSTPSKLRPWLQAFDLGAIYTPDMVHKQMQGVYDAGLTSWMLWNAANVYNKQALLFPQ